MMDKYIREARVYPACLGNAPYMYIDRHVHEGVVPSISGTIG